VLVDTMPPLWVLLLKKYKMTGIEKICDDVKAWVRYSGGSEGDICVYRRCPECGKYLKAGKVLTNMEGEAKLKGYTCKKHGEVEPFYLRD
jgi:hypothetical protein